MTAVEPHPRTGLLDLSLDRWQVLLAAGVWLLFHSYQGLIHDSRLYTAQAMRVLDPASFENDLFFSFGSQDAFTAFPWIHALFVATLGVAWSGLVLTLMGQALWLSGAFALFGRAANGSKLVWGLLGLALLPPAYGGFVVFQYGEGFITARLFAEALTLWALALAPSRRVSAALLTVAAAAIHPLYGAAAMALVVLLLAHQDRRWALLIPLGAACALGLAAAGMAPFTGLFEVMDSDWRSIVELRNVVCFPLLWRAEDFAGVALDVIVILLAAEVLLVRSRPLLVSILVVSLGGFALSSLGDASNNLFLIQLQPSRALWLMAAAANFSIGVAAYELVRRETGRAVLGMLSVGFILQLFPYFALVLTTVGAWFALRLLREPLKKPPVVIQALAYVIVVGAGVAYLCSRGLQLGQDLTSALSINSDWVIALLRQPSQIDGLAAVVILCLWTYNSQRIAPVLPAIAVGIFALGAINWNARSAFQRDSEEGRGLEDFRSLIPEDSLVFWHSFGAVGDSESSLVWFGLERRPYLSLSQGAGLIFNRETAIEYDRRVQQLGGVLPRDYLGLLRETLKAFRERPSPGLGELRSACGRAPELDYVVLGAPVDAPALSVFAPRSAPVLLDLLGERPPESLRSARFYAYACEDLRSVRHDDFSSAVGAPPAEPSRR